MEGGATVRRYLTFEGLPAVEQTASAMRDARFGLCEKLFSNQPEPAYGVLDTWEGAALEKLALLGWYDLPLAPSTFILRAQAKKKVYECLARDADCLSPGEHQLVEQLLALGGTVDITSAEVFDAALGLRNRLWCDIGSLGGVPAVRLDPALTEPLREAFSRFEHVYTRSRIFTFDAMIHAMLYAAGFLHDELPRERFCVDVLDRDPKDAAANRLARNYVEAAYDCVVYAECRLLLHEALALPESFVEQLAMRGANIPPMTPAQMLGCMNGMLPEEEAIMQSLKRALQYALRPGIHVDDAANDLKMLTKQGVPLPELARVTSDMLCVMPTPAITNALQGLVAMTPRWV
jgi:hypothetical protein